jgi:hypothetical protein
MLQSKEPLALSSTEMARLGGMVLAATVGCQSQRPASYVLWHDVYSTDLHRPDHMIVGNKLTGNSVIKDLYSELHSSHASYEVELSDNFSQSLTRQLTYSQSLMHSVCG